MNHNSFAKKSVVGVSGFNLTIIIISLISFGVCSSPLTGDIPSESQAHQPQTNTSNNRTIIIDASKTGPPISKYVYGQFIEHQGRCIYGGIWAEMLRDRKFFYPVNFYFPWGEFEHQSPWKPTAFDTIVIMDRENSYVGEHTPRLELDGTSPRGIMQDGLALEKGKTYEGRIVLAGDSSINVEISLVRGPRQNDRQTVTIPRLTKAYKKWPLSFAADADTKYGRLEIVGKGHGGFRIGAASLMPADNIKGMRADTIKLLKKLNATVYRWPGGLFVNDYQWRQAVGDRDKRPPRENSIYWSVDIESRDFGPDEFMTLCEVVDAAAYVVVSAMNPEDARMAAAEVEYFNGPPDSPMGRLRASNGHPEPYNVKFWGVGNEMWDFMPLEKYISIHKKIAQAMRSADPSIKLIAVGGLGMEGLARERGWPEVDWAQGILRECAESMDLVGEHIYCGEADNVFEHIKQMTNGIEGIVSAHRHYRNHLDSLKGKDIRLALDEWNYWYGPEIYGEAGIRRYHQDALGMAAGLHEMFRNSDMIFMANTHPVNVHGCIKTTKTEAVEEVQALALQIYRNHFGNLPVAVMGEFEPLDVAAALTDDREFITLGIVNPSREEHKRAIELQHVRPNGKVQLWRIANPDPMAYNAPGEKPNVVIEEHEIETFSNKINVPPLSINLYRFAVR